MESLPVPNVHTHPITLHAAQMPKHLHTPSLPHAFGYTVISHTPSHPHTPHTITPHLGADFKMSSTLTIISAASAAYSNTWHFTLKDSVTPRADMSPTDPVVTSTHKQEELLITCSDLTPNNCVFVCTRCNVCH